MRFLLDLAFRLAYRFGFAAALVVWRLRRPSHNGALVAIRTNGKVLLVRQSYRRAFSLPGGGVNRGETPMEAARRELVEELGLRLETADLRHAHTETALWDYREDTVDFFEVAVDDEIPVAIDRREIVDARFVPEDRLPELALTGPARFYLELAAKRRASSAARNSARAF